MQNAWGSSEMHIKFCMVDESGSCDKWDPVTTAWCDLRLQIEERPPIWRVAGCIVADSREGVFLELWGWMRW